MPPWLDCSSSEHSWCPCPAHALRWVLMSSHALTALFCSVVKMQQVANCGHKPCWEGGWFLVVSDGFLPGGTDLLLPRAIFHCREKALCNPSPPAPAGSCFSLVLGVLGVGAQPGGPGLSPGVTIRDTKRATLTPQVETGKQEQFVMI